MEMKEVPAKAKREDEEKRDDEPKQSIKTEEEANPGHYSSLLSPSEEVYTEAYQSVKSCQELPGSARLYCVMCVCLSVICLILLMAVVILGVKLQAKSTVNFEEEKTGTNRDGPFMVNAEKLCMEHLRKTCAGSEQCPYKWLTYRNYCFFLSTFRLTWEESQSKCTSVYGSLAVITSQEVQNFLTEKGNLLYWIGLKKHQSVWKWVNNKTLEKSYWATNENDGGCALFSSHSPPQRNWIPVSCQAPSYFICQLEY
ncbi:C-type lectin domain family 1 member B [Oryzias melastigma]|uniref:C-type lectin domain family 1 member B n=1 Tax=Oryzias melastigma TaxID=30732 RepID=A0A3B3DHI3_ORYME|nr:C-type lectin domain family 1 member B isoform X1 [Oryzias melastigma]KAF6735154.1 C-type lectin domain family 1 member B [Oryzias melastigma]